MKDIDFDYGSDQEVSENHSKLLEAVSQLDKGQRVKKPQRSEPSLEVSEFHLVKSGVSENDAVGLQDLAKTLGQKATHADISKKFSATQNRSKVLAKPLEKPAAERIKRVVGFENVKKDLNKWNGIVARNRTAEKLTFPLRQPSMKVDGSTAFIQRFRIQSELEKELAALEPKQEKPEEKEEEFPLTLEEILQRRQETARFRAQQSYKEAKAHRQNKIKSKKFHRIQRKERIKQQLKEFEELQKTNPQAALEKLQQLDQARAQERMSLRHKSTGQWAKNKQVRAKYNKESRQALAQQLSISRELTQKVQKDDNSEDDDEKETVLPSASDKENPWVNGVKTQSEIDDFISGYRKYWNDRNKLEKEKKSPEETPKKIKKSTKQNAKVVPKIKELPNSLNPVEEVIIEDLNNTNHDLENKDSSDSENSPKLQINSVTKPKSSKQKASPQKLSEKLKKGSAQQTNSSSIQQKSVESKIKKKSKTKKPISTAEWSVTPLGSDDTVSKCSPSKIDKIDDIFDAMEDNIENRIEKKLQKIKRKYKAVLSTDEQPSKKKKNSQDEYTGDLGFKKQKRVPIIDERMDETANKTASKATADIVQLKKLAQSKLSSTSNTKNPEIDPSKYINVKPKYMKSQLPDDIAAGDEAIDDNEREEEQQNIISEAFADDDVVDEFRKEKEEEVKKGQPENLDLTLPGWGSWGGKNIKVSSRKKRRFILKFPKDVPRKDENKGDVIILEEKDPKIKEHQVSEVPFPFTSVKDFEASIRAPIGRTFVPENAHKRLIRPAVVTKMGQVIEPMDEDALIKTNTTKVRRRTGANKKRTATKKKRTGK
ncbi:U3 small nucleolar RNA-associated protein 14 homolog A [Cephus cinctus]|uniref:U3 small nucleolar RNA-associated protein 14 homolog A n=1 Tax=Cephus cinctus TaxID=211228 RepID=A0AAJ7C7T9_CEPCN|nr:U3 small nucleolar RNA-associated protein 14 homolog A [Cephus cinctus]